MEQEKLELFDKLWNEDRGTLEKVVLDLSDEEQLEFLDWSQEKARKEIEEVEKRAIDFIKKDKIELSEVDQLHEMINNLILSKKAYELMQNLSDQLRKMINKSIDNKIELANLKA